MNILITLLFLFLPTLLLVWVFKYEYLKCFNNIYNCYLNKAKNDINAQEFNQIAKEALLEIADKKNLSSNDLKDISSQLEITL